MLSIGIGGQIGSGKTTVAKELVRLFSKNQHKVKLISADQIAWQIYQPGSKIYQKIVQQFGNGILSPNCEINRKKLGEIVFGNQQKLALLNKLVHPELIRQLKNELKSTDNKIKILDAALLFDWAKKIPVNYRILVTAPTQQKINRLRKQGFSQKVIRNCLKQQMEESKMAEHADFVIVNNRSLPELKKKVQFLYREVISNL